MKRDTSRIGNNKGPFFFQFGKVTTSFFRQRVMMQIVQELCKRPGLNRTGFDMPTIYIPNPNKTVRCVNQIDDVCRDVEKTINQTIQVKVL